MYAPTVARGGASALARGLGVPAGLPVPNPVGSLSLTRPTFAAAPVPTGEDVYAAKLRNAPATAAAAARRTVAAGRAVAPWLASDVRVTAARLARAAGNVGRAVRLEAALSAASVDKTDERVIAERGAAAALATARERSRLLAAVAGRNAVPVADRGVVRVLDGTSSPGVALALTKQQASARREPANMPAHVEAALAPTPEMAAAAAELGDGEASPPVAAQLAADTARRGLGFSGLSDPANGAAGISLGVWALLGLGAWLLLKR